MTLPSPDDTIAAIASAPGGAARGLLRLSGHRVECCVEAVFCADPPTKLSRVTRPTVLTGFLSLPPAQTRLPGELYYWPGQRSYTGQPVAEFHTIGSPPLLEAALEQLCAAGVRLAEPGEFTLRAFLARRIDLVQAEAVLGVIDAADSRELDVALAQLAGGLGTPLSALRDRLLDLLAHLEAGLDFADEDIAFITPQELDGHLLAASEAVAGLARQLEGRAESSDLVRVVLVGSPNVGKSSLFNALAGKSGAIVSHLPGTTRDYLTAELNLEGGRCLLVDTAGVEQDESAPLDGPDRTAQTVASQQNEQARLRILCLDATRPVNDWEAALLAEPSSGRLVVLTKTDAAPPPFSVPSAIPTSSATGAGIETLRAELGRLLLAVARPGMGAVAGTALRCRESLRLAAESLLRARQLVQQHGGEELVATEVRMALEELGRVVGAVYTDDLLDRVFSRFCIGK